MGAHRVILPDANLLIYAYNEDTPLHSAAASWLEDLLSGSETVCFSWAVMNAFMRLSTMRRMNRNPLAAGEALAIVESWLRAPPARVMDPTNRHIVVLGELMRSLGITGNLTSDAHLAVLAIEHGATIHSADSDFAKFAGVNWLNPLTGYA